MTIKPNFRRLQISPEVHKLLSARTSCPAETLWRLIDQAERTAALSEWLKRLPKDARTKFIARSARELKYRTATLDKMKPAELAQLAERRLPGLELVGLGALHRHLRGQLVEDWATHARSDGGSAGLISAHLTQHDLERDRVKDAFSFLSAKYPDSQVVIFAYFVALTEEECGPPALDWLRELADNDYTVSASATLSPEPVPTTQVATPIFAQPRREDESFSKTRTPIKTADKDLAVNGFQDSEPHAQPTGYRDLMPWVEILSTNISNLKNELEIAKEQLSTSHILPQESLDSSIRDAREALSAARRAFVDAGIADGDNLYNPTDFRSVAERHDLRVQEGVLQEAMATLARARRIKSSTASVALGEVHNTIAQYEANLRGENAIDVARAICNPNHAVRALLRLVERRPDDAGELFLDDGFVVGGAFGTSVAIAATLRQLRLESVLDVPLPDTGSIDMQTARPRVENDSDGQESAGSWNDGGVENSSEPESGASPPGAIGQAAHNSIISRAELDSVVVDQPGSPSSLPTNDASVVSQVDAVPTTEALGEQVAADTTDAVAIELIGRSELALAYHYMRINAGEDALLTSLLAANRLAGGIWSQASPSLTPLRDLLNREVDSMAHLPAEEHDAYALLQCAACIRPALFLQEQTALQLLAGTEFRTANFKAVWDYCQYITENVSHGLAITPHVLASVKSIGELDAALAENDRQISNWLERSQQVRFSYHAATRVWLNWLDSEGLLRAVANEVLAKDVMSEGDLHNWAIQLASPADIRRFVDETDKKVLNRRRGEPITAATFSQMLAKTKELSDLFQERLSIQATRRLQKDATRLGRAQRVRDTLVNKQRDVVAQLRQVADNPQHIPLLRSVSLATISLWETLNSILSKPFSHALDESQVPKLLNADLLRVGTALTESWEVDVGQADDVSAIIGEAVEQRTIRSWESAVDEWFAAQNYLAVAQLLDDPPMFIEHRKVEELRRLRHKALVDGRSKIRRLAAEVQRAVENAAILGILSDRDRGTLLGEVDAVLAALDSTDALQRLIRRLDTVQSSLEVRRADVAAEVRDRLSQLSDKPSESDLVRVNALLDRGDVLTADEYVGYLEAGMPLPEHTRVHDAFQSFFPGVVRSIDAVRRPTTSQIVDRIKAGGDIGAISFARISEAQVKQAVSAVETWYAARTSKADESAELAIKTFAFLGFNVLGAAPRATTVKGASRIWFEVITEPVRDRSRCPSSQFGSSAAGDFSSGRAKYRVLVLWEELTAEDLLGAVGETAQESPTVVIYLNRFSEDRRRALARLSRERRRTFLLLDETLLLHLCAEPSARMPLLFQCALPFTYLDPYVTVGSVVPPEVFYGREEERKSVVDPHGSCFIFGGRQLGKTALLRHVERRFHAPAEDRYAVYMDLKYYGIGFDRPIDDFWPILADRLKTVGVLPANTQSSSNSRKIIDAVVKSVGADAHARVLLLLDETDKFIEADTEFTRVAALKGAMDATDRRFKVVFAGLHNVQRSTRVSNNPLAHLGAPLCVGPLFQGGEIREAAKLLEDPLSMLGYRFDSPDLVARIISQANYYPSLLQLYGNQLLRSLNRPGVEVFDSKTSPPYVIQEKHVTAAYDAQDFYRHIKDRFTWTLDLDTRYRLIALICALYAVEATDISEPLTAADVRSRALNWWPAGFAGDTTEDAFRALLDEMVGLGILRQDDPGVYALRSRNVALLMGSRDEIETELLDLAERPGPIPYEPTAHRRPSGGEHNTQVPSYSAITRAQELTVLDPSNGVSVVAGADASIAMLPKHLKEAVAGVPISFVRAGKTLSKFLDELDDLVQRPKGQPFVLCVSPESNWDVEWVREAVDRVQSAPSKRPPLRVVFAADSIILAGLQQSNLWERLLTKSVSIFTAGPWAATTLRTWLDDMGVIAKHVDDYSRRITLSTGLWPALLAELGGRLHGKRLPWISELERYDSEWSDPAVARSRGKLIGIADGPWINILRLLNDVDEASVADIQLFYEGPKLDVKNAFEWADRLRLVLPVGNSSWQPDPIVKKVLSHS